MASFLLFFPNSAGRSVRSLLESADMLDFLPGAAQASVVLDGVSGTLIGWGDRIGVEPDRQTWGEDCGGYRVGFWVDANVTPEDLAKPDQFSGYRAVLADGNEWVIPAASMLPTSLVRDKSKHWKRVRKPQFDQFWRESEVWFRRNLKCGLDLQEMLKESRLSEQAFLDAWVKFVVFVLRQNYRVTEDVVSSLRLLDSRSLYMVTLYAVDGMAIEELEADQDAANMTEKKIAESSPPG